MLQRVAVLVVVYLGVGLGGSAGATVLRDGQRWRSIERLSVLDPVATAQRVLLPVRMLDERGETRARMWVGREVLVQLGPGGEDALAAAGVRLERAVLPSLGWWRVESQRPGEDALTLAERLQGDAQFGGALREVVPDWYVSRTRTSDGGTTPPNDPRYSAQWFFQKLGMEDAWAIERGQSTVTVAVIDDGCDLHHPDLVDKLDPGRDVIDGDDDPSFVPNIKGNNHGTACAGLVAASTDNGIGVAGACPGCRLRCVRLLDAADGPIPVSADADAFQFALDSGAAVVSNSWGFTMAMPVPQPLADAIAMVHSQGRGGLGSIVVFAAGNDSRRIADDELEAAPGVFAVGAVNNFAELAQFSNTGAAIDVVAPTGTNTTDISGPDGDDPGDYFASFGGTSSACPIVAGIAGLLVSAAPDKTATEIEAAMTMTAKQSLFASPDASGHDESYGWGEIQPAAALRIFKPDMSTTMKPGKGCGCQVGGRGDAAAGPLLLVLLCAMALARLPRRNTRASTLKVGPLDGVVG